MDSLSKYQTSIDDLPMEIIVEIFRYLNFGDLQSAALTCRGWLQASKSKEFMEKIVVCLTDRWDYPPVQLFLNSQRSFPNIRIEHNSCKMTKEFFKRMGTSAVTAKITDDSLSYTEFLAVLQDLRHLRTLKISGPLGESKIFKDSKFLESSTDRNAIAATMANIRKLSIRVWEFSDVNFLRLTSLISELESLNMTGCYIIPDTEQISIEELLTKHPSESELTFNSICGIIAVHQATLHELKFDQTMFYEETMSALCELKDLKLRTLSVRAFLDVDSIGFRAFLETQSSLRHLDLDNSYFVTDECVETIVKALKNLEILDLEGCLQITDSGVLAIAKLRKLQTLYISGCDKITSKGIMKGIASVPNKVLRQLYMSRLDLTEECVKLCAQQLPELRVLDLCYCSDGVTDRSVQAIIRNLKWLRELRLEGCIKITDAGLTGPNGGAPIHQLKGLRSLHLGGCKQISDVSLISSFKFIELRCLDLSGCGKISAIGIEALAKNCPSLEELDLYDCKNINDKTIKAVTSQLKRLKN